jgi:SNF2 family DNA or RNA helicase
VAPLSVTSSWVRHVQTIWPAAKIAVLNPKNRDALAKQLREPYHYYVVHWEALRLMPELYEVNWWHVIADEVHRAKNRKAQQTIGLKKLKTSYKTGLSGTPADNQPQDLWSILHWLYPKVWSSYHRFVYHHVKIQKHPAGQCTAFGCDKYHKNAYQKIMGVSNVEELHKNIQPYYMRRTKEEVIKDLPDKYFSQIEVELPPRQRRIYNQMKESMLAWVGKHEQEPIAAPIIVAQLTRLKQFALAYAELETYYKTDDQGEKVAFQRVRLTDPSTKLDAVMDVLEDSLEQVVVFSESKQMIYLLKARLDKAGITCATLTGDTPHAERGKIVDEFQAGNIRVFAGTIAAGGEGITLTAASTVIFLDRTWNPSKNKQAEDRLHRIGQKNAVHVIDIVAKDTVDGGRLQQLKLKWSWLKQLLGDKTVVEIDA